MKTKENNLIKNLNWIKIKTLDETEYIVKHLINNGFKMKMESRISISAYPIIYLCEGIIYTGWSFLDFKTDTSYKEISKFELAKILKDKGTTRNYSACNISTTDLVHELQYRDYIVKLIKKK